MHARTTFMTAGIIGVLSVAAVQAYADKVSTEDFVRKASVANEFEIESSRLALQKSGNGDVKTFAQEMIDDHTQTGEKLKDTLESSSAKTEPATKLDSKHQKLMDKLGALSGPGFDRQYIALQTDAHREAVALFGSYAENGEDEALKGFAGDTLPALKMHLQHVQQLSSK